MSKLLLLRSTPGSVGAPAQQCCSWAVLAHRHLSLEVVSPARLLEVFGYRCGFQVLKVLGFYLQLPNFRSWSKLS